MYSVSNGDGGREREREREKERTKRRGNPKGLSGSRLGLTLFVGWLLA